ncbi:MAG: arginine repressor [Bacillota bacterium]|nr:arginine repressor [Bacillota bacterium]
MKSRRHFAIMDILSSGRIATQEELGEALQQKGYNVTQATVSRDIKELCLIKIPDENGYHYAAPDAHGQRSSNNERVKRIFRDSVVNYNHSENIIVIKTLPGAAQSIGSLIDAMDNNHILGNVAGDDTIFIVVKPKEAVDNVLRVFKELLSE